MSRKVLKILLILALFFVTNKGLAHIEYDHLGNVRSVVNENGDVLQYIHYYPNGNIIPALSTNASLQPYKYNGKELDKMHGLDWYDYGARNYDAVLSRWDRIDPLAEKYYHISPYAYCVGNPVKNVDPDGKIVETAWDIANVLMDVTSLAYNISKGNYGDALIDGGGLLLDAAAVALPFVPGGAGTAIKAGRAADKAIDAAKAAVKTADKVSDVTKDVKKSSFLENTARGRQSEKMVLDAEGYKKNTKPITDYKTGYTTIPDSAPNGAIV